MAEQQITIFNIGENREAMNAAMSRPTSDSHLFDPKLKNLQDTDTFIVRPLPYVHDPYKSLTRKRFYALNDELGTFYFDSKTTFNNPVEKHYEFCEPSEIWLKLRNSQDPRIQERCKSLRIQNAAYCYVLIVAYPKDASLNGQILPFKVPMEMIKAFEQMMSPNDQQIALGATSVQPFDIFGGKNITCTITGHMEGQTLMRKWTIVPDQLPSEVKLPLGPGNSFIPVSQIPQEQVVKMFTDTQVRNLNDEYGYHEPTLDAKRRMKAYLRRLVADIPALHATVDGYFPEIEAQAAADFQGNNAPAATQVSGITTVSPGGAPTPAPTMAPTAVPSQEPTMAPTMAPQPTAAPSMAPSMAPTPQPTLAPTPMPTLAPTAAPSPAPTAAPAPEATMAPTMAPTGPATAPTAAPTMAPSQAPIAPNIVLP